MRIGGTVFKEYDSPESWALAVRESGYTAARDFLPLDADDDLIAAYAKAAEGADIQIAEIGAWGANPLAPDPDQRHLAMEKIVKRLQQAEKIGARCCVNTAGFTKGRKKGEPIKNELTEEAFEQVVESVREIIDAVKPTRTFYTLECMPWILPHSADAYRRLIDAIDRKAFAVHFDPVNLVNSPEKYYNNGELIKDFCRKLGPHIKSCHAKDISLVNELTVHLCQACPGRGAMDYPTLLREINRLDPDMPFILEYLETEEQFQEATAYIRSVAKQEGLEI